MEETVEGVAENTHPRTQILKKGEVLMELVDHQLLHGSRAVPL